MRPFLPLCLLVTCCLGLLLPAPAGAQQTYDAHCVEKLPGLNPSGWERLGKVEPRVAADKRLVKYGSEAASQLTNDSVKRTLDTAPTAAAADTSFMMAYDTQGWYLYIRCVEPQIAQAIQDNSSQLLEIFFSTTGPQDPLYSRIEVNLITGKAQVTDLLGRTDAYRPLSKALQVKREILPGGQAWGTCVFIPWSYFHDRLPLDGQSWQFTFMRWGTRGGVTWGGKVHEKGNWGMINWQSPTDAQRQQIQVAIIKDAWKRFQEAAARARAYWQTYENDVTFHDQKVQPLVNAYDQYASQVKDVDALQPSDVAKLYPQVHQWMNFDRQIDLLRRDYLLRRLVNNSPVQSPSGN